MLPVPGEQWELPTRLPSFGLAGKGKDRHAVLAQLSATKDAGPQLRWDPGQAGEGGRERFVILERGRCE